MTVSALENCAVLAFDFMRGFAEGGAYLEVVLGGLESGIGDLAVVDDDGITLGAALLIGPADALGELGIRVGQEELKENISE